MRKLFLFAALLVAAQSFAQTKQQRAVATFSGISVSTGIQVEITQGNEESVFISVSDDAYAENLKTVVENELLKIYFENKNWADKKMQKLRLKAFVSYKTIDKIKLSSGAVMTTMTTVSVPSLSVDISSGAQFKGEVKVESLSIDQSSGANSTISGTATNVQANLSSGSVCTVTNTSAENCKVVASSGASMKIAVSKNITANASSGAFVGYKGEPVVNKKTSSGGAVKKI